MALFFILIFAIYVLISVQFLVQWWLCCVFRFIFFLLRWNLSCIRGLQEGGGFCNMNSRIRYIWIQEVQFSFCIRNIWYDRLVWVEGVVMGFWWVWLLTWYHWVGNVTLIMIRNTYNTQNTWITFKQSHRIYDIVYTWNPFGF